MEYCPDEITASVMEIEQFTMSEVRKGREGACTKHNLYFQEVRGRYKSLNHLPLTCELALCEVELKAPILSQDTLNQFSSEIHRRRQKRSKKKKDERRREKRAEAKNPPPPGEKCGLSPCKLTYPPPPPGPQCDSNLITS